MPALVMALLLIALCTFTLDDVRRKLGAGSVSSELLEEGPSPLEAPQDTPLRSRASSPTALWLGRCAALPPCLGANGSDANSSVGIDAASVVGYCIAIAYACFIIRYAARVDFLALASMTPAPSVLSVTLYAFPGQAAQKVASVLNVAMGVCFEIILLIYFVRVAQRQNDNRAFWPALGSCAGYLGVLARQLGTVLFAREMALTADKPLWCLG